MKKRPVGLVPAHLNSAIEHLTQAVHSDDNEAIIAHLQRLIPEFQRTNVELAAANTGS